MPCQVSDDVTADQQVRFAVPSPMTDAPAVNRFGALFDRRKRACLTLLVTARLADFHHLHAERSKPFNPLVFVALAELRPQRTQLVLEDNWPWQLTRCMLNVTP
jgi:hypothetical protein